MQPALQLTLAVFEADVCVCVCVCVSAVAATFDSLIITIKGIAAGMQNTG